MLFPSVNEQVFYRFLDEIEELVGWYWNRVLSSFSFKRQGSGWLLSVKVSGYGKGQIAFIDAESLVGCIERFYLFCKNPPYSGIKWQIARW